MQSNFALFDFTTEMKELHKTVQIRKQGRHRCQDFSLQVKQFLLQLK